MKGSHGTVTKSSNQETPLGLLNFVNDTKVVLPGCMHKPHHFFSIGGQLMWWYGKWWVWEYKAKLAIRPMRHWVLESTESGTCFRFPNYRLPLFPSSPFLITGYKLAKLSVLYAKQPTHEDLSAFNRPRRIARLRNCYMCTVKVII